MQHPAPHAQGDIATLIHRLGHAGLIPFVGLAGLMWLVEGDVHAFVAMALSAYAATIAAFLGGIHWGMGLPLDAPARRFHLVWGVIPSPGGLGGLADARLCRTAFVGGAVGGLLRG